MLTFLVLAGLATSSLALPMPSGQVANFFDSVLEEASHLISVNRRLPDIEVSFKPVLQLSWSVQKVVLRGPTKMESAGSGSAEAVETGGNVHSVGMASLGQLDSYYAVSLDLFGKVFSTEVQFSVQDAYSNIIIDVGRSNLASCQVSVTVEPPVGSYIVHFGSQGGAAKLVTGLLNIALSYAFPYIPNPQMFKEYELFPDLTKHLERDLTIAARRIACN